METDRSKYQLEVKKPQNRIIQDGEHIIAYQSPEVQFMLKIEDGKSLNTRYGLFEHDCFIGKRYGEKVWSKDKRYFFYALKIDRTFFTQNQCHRTQILYSIDISMAILFLNIKPGDVVCESGTGSGSMSYSIGKALGVTGHLYTFEFNEERASEIKKDFERYNITNITATRRDVYSDGFTIDGVLGGESGVKADSIFIDLPSPWKATKHASDIIKLGGRQCNFSPCIEQVEKTIAKLSKLGFGNFVTYECLERKFERRLLRPKSFLEEFSKKKLKAEAEKDDRDAEITNANGQEPNNDNKEDTVDKIHEEILVEEDNKFKRKEGQFTFSMGYDKGKWHTGYLTFCTKLI